MKKIVACLLLLSAAAAIGQRSPNVGKIEVFEINIGLNKTVEIERLDEKGSVYTAYEIRPISGKAFVKCSEKWPQVECYQMMIAWTTWKGKAIKPKWQVMNNFSLLAIEPREKGTSATLVFSLDMASTMRGIGEAAVSWNEKEQRFKASRGNGILFEVKEISRQDEKVDQGCYGYSRRYLPSWGSWTMRRALLSDAQIKKAINDFIK